ncbi:MAG: deoxynucleoside kinase [Chloroflexi bacterium]|nr:deoxynucleoside kinase [Chloroflexota bacterium]
MFIVVAGAIGAGKSTVTRIFSQISGFEPLYETVEGHPYLEKFYKDPPRWAFHTQVFFLYDRFNKHYATVQSKKDIIADRSIYEDAIFAKVLWKRGEMSEDEYVNTYKPHFELLTKILRPPDLLIYLRASLDTLIYRIAKRSRKMESGIPRDYLMTLNDSYEEWIGEYPHRKLIVETDDLDFTCDLHPDWFWLVEAIYNKVIHNDIPDRAIGLSGMKSRFPQSRLKNGKNLKEEIFATGKAMEEFPGVAQEFAFS